MKSKKTITIFLILIIIFAGCTEKQFAQLPLVKIKDQKIPDLDFLKLKNKTTIRLSQIAENIHVVQLETRPECLLSNVVYYIGNKYILAEDISGVFQYDIKGKFIRKLVSRGKGPGEIPTPFPRYFLAEDENLFLTVTRDHIYRYVLSSGKYLSTKGKSIVAANEQLNSLRYVKDSLILYSYFNVTAKNADLAVDSLGCGVRLQNMNGKILWQKKFNYSSWVIHPIRKIGILGGSGIWILSTMKPDEFIFQISDHDTVYKFNSSTYSLKPSLIRRTENQKKEGFPIDRVAINCNIEYDEYASVNGYQLMRFQKVTEIKSDGKYDVELSYILFDDSFKRAFKIGIFENDYLSFSHNVDDSGVEMRHIPYLGSPNGKLLEVYEANEFLELAKKTLAKPDLSIEVRERLLKFNSNLNEYSNPVLIIADMKKRIDL